jgi:hypothetical protein
MWFIYLIVFVLIIYISLTAYIKIKMKFWYTQPVFHIYNISYWLNPPGIILDREPEINKYTNILDIKTHGISDINETLLDRACNFIKAYYVQSPNAKYIPTKKNIVEYLKSCNNESYLSIYQTPKLLFEKDEPSSVVDDIISVISARPLNITLKGKNPFTLYYVDNLCVHPDYRKDGIAPKTIQTHYYNLRKNNPKIKICLFKREGELNAIVPLTIYKTVCFNISILQKMNPGVLNVIEIGPNQLNLFVNFIYSQSKNFDCIIMPDLSNILNMIKTENIYVYGVLENNNLISAYAFRRPSLFYDKDEAIECFFSLYDKSLDKLNVYITGFNISLNKCKEKLKTNILLIENIGQSGKLVDYLRNNLLNVLFQSPTAFFLYNYACYTVPSKNALIFY